MFSEYKISLYIGIAYDTINMLFTIMDSHDI